MQIFSHWINAQMAHLAYLLNDNGTETTGWQSDLETREIYRYTRCC